jgi:hypothetical protein
MRISPSPHVFDEISPASQLAPPYLTLERFRTCEVPTPMSFFFYS